MESIIFIMMFMVLDNNQYIEYTNNILTTQKSLAKISDVLLKNNVNMKLLSALMYIRKLNFSQIPNYEYMKSLIL